MNDLAYDLARLCKHNRDGSFATQANRRRGLAAMATELRDLGYKLPCARSLKPKHIDALVARWQQKGLSPGTIKNRMGWVRWWAEKVDKASAIPKDNASLGIAQRKQPANNRAWHLEDDKPALEDPRMDVSLRLMAAFGLRVEEALKLKPVQADKGHVLRLQASWTKGGRARDIPIRTDEIRQLLAEAIALVGTGSLIPPDKSYIQHRKAFEHAALKHGLTNLHGLRHAYAQSRYAELTGWLCPKAGGMKYRELTSRERQLDRQARQIVSEELGHARISITKTYLG